VDEPEIAWRRTERFFLTSRVLVSVCLQSFYSGVLQTDTGNGNHRFFQVERLADYAGTHNRPCSAFCKSKLVCH
jgi:hypothetical protein